VWRNRPHGARSRFNKSPSRKWILAQAAQSGRFGPESVRPNKDFHCMREEGKKRLLERLNKRTLSAATLSSPRAAALLHPGRADMDDGKPEQGERQRLVGQCKPDRNDREQGRDAQRDLDEGDG